MTTASGLVDHYFRHEYGRLVALLTRKVGTRHLDRVEDAVQAALMAALTAWTAQGLPDDAGAWLYRVASNNLIGDLHRGAGRRRILERAAGAVSGLDESQAPHFAAEVADDMLRMLFVCCDDAVPRDSQLVLALKTLCGFSTGEIALRLFTSEANVYKRLARARGRLRRAPFDLGTPSLDTLASRLPSVHAVLYLLFNEGYLSAHAAEAIRRELCEEAIRLVTLLAEHPVGAVPETSALLALMHLHAARLAARQDGEAGLLLLEEQDRALVESGTDGARRHVAGAVGQRRRVFALPSRGRHCRRALLRALFRADPLGREARLGRSANRGHQERPPPPGVDGMSSRRRRSADVEELELTRLVVCHRPGPLRSSGVGMYKA